MTPGLSSLAIPAAVAVHAGARALQSSGEQTQTLEFFRTRLKGAPGDQ
jgi:hypothetical protein